MAAEMQDAAAWPLLLKGDVKVLSKQGEHSKGVLHICGCTRLRLVYRQCGNRRCPAAQIEARARQMEGRDLGQQAAAPGGKPPPGKYERGRQGAAPGLLSEPKAYNPDADATATAGKEEKKKVSAYVRRAYPFGLTSQAVPSKPRQDT
jgi:hypothetical protein